MLLTYGHALQAPTVHVRVLNGASPGLNAQQIILAAQRTLAQQQGGVQGPCTQTAASTSERVMQPLVTGLRTGGQWAQTSHGHAFLTTHTRCWLIEDGQGCAVCVGALGVGVGSLEVVGVFAGQAVNAGAACSSRQREQVGNERAQVC
jgi:hypothetical protein